MRGFKTVSLILLILPIFSFVLAAPVAVREINEVRVNAVEVAKVGMATSEKRMDPGPGDQSSTNVAYLTDESVIEWNTISPESTASSSTTPSELNTATSRQPLPTGPHPESIDDSPSRPGSTDDYPLHLGSTEDSPSHSGTTYYSLPGSPDDPPSHSGTTYYSLPGSPDDPPSHSGSIYYSPSRPGSTDNSPSHPGSIYYSLLTGPTPPSQSVSTTGDHSPPSTEPQHPVAPESENFFVKLIKGKFMRRISGCGPGECGPEGVAGYRRTVGPGATLLWIRPFGARIINGVRGVSHRARLPARIDKEAAWGGNGQTNND
ncbi:hypothetical protein BGY98DRAFT_932380 [Russula aff. rugulosa BPL654]|nr:hypothetical protein BGY98DRAFT_932380 [Russula aff. rugulosa BPL654]